MAATMTTTVTSPDIVCDGCANAIKNAVGRLEGVESVKVDVAGKEVRVDHTTAISRGDIEKALDGAGFPVSD
jgi:copper chaperone